LHGTSSGKGTRKFHFWRLLIGGEITKVAWDGQLLREPALDLIANTANALEDQILWMLIPEPALEIRIVELARFRGTVGR
ncbi:hypothetical protein, partial [Xanthomonas euvesicatoria]|uniref:hypothetical protein n=1 Tax=Xanthomonas euvesicatoria TaxID=456327 RepID=UPI001C488ECB